jgi:hypothetical protein
MAPPAANSRPALVIVVVTVLVVVMPPAVLCVVCGLKAAWAAPPARLVVSHDFHVFLWVL